MTNITWGADPEVFSGYMSQNKLMVLPPAYFRELGVGVVPDPEKPTHPRFIIQKDYIVHEDGVAFEVGVSPSTDWKELFERIQSAYDDLRNTILLNHTDDCDGEVHILPTIGFDVERWAKAPDSFKQCLIFGCDRDWDAFDTEREAKVLDVQKHPERYGGGHVHMSGSPLFEIDPIMAVKCQALTSGMAAIAYSDTPDLDHQRTFLYGRPGKYRVQNYSDGSVGIEYRTPSNRWTSSEEIAGQLFKWARIGIEELLETDLGPELVNKYGNEAADAIINTDQEVAHQILDRISERI